MGQQKWILLNIDRVFGFVRMMGLEVKICRLSGEERANLLTMIASATMFRRVVDGNWELRNPTGVLVV